MPPLKAPKNASAATAAVGGRDHISNLPDGVLQYILSLLPAQDVVRTCVLAKRWCHMWKSTTELHFICGRTTGPESMEEIQEFVDHLLCQRIREGTPLDTCVFDLGEIHDDDMSRIILWIRIALQCKVRVLQLMRLAIRRGYFGEESRLPICAPNLVSLRLEVRGGRTPSLQRMPSLTTASVKIDSYDDRVSLDSDNDSNQSILLQGLSEVRALVLKSPDTEMFIFRRDLKFCSSFNKLKSLHLDVYWCEPADFSALAFLLKLSPVLQKLTLQLYSKVPKLKVEIKLSCKPSEKSAAIAQHLKTVEIKCQEYDCRVRNVLTKISSIISFHFSFCQIHKKMTISCLLVYVVDEMSYQNTKLFFKNENVTLM
ncbi:hypothetical protein SORBI_3005G073700 [Sorghum bicolor]|uniref:F-box domain-containing protein n=1 Tax=Sorghum bicolor TaxID=4558 RepID=A0A1Z5RI27_SORBI|nr:hypothetical protein SORBI_3005G073700 [Sorghum bicolor]